MDRTQDGRCDEITESPLGRVLRDYRQPIEIAL